MNTSKKTESCWEFMNCPDEKKSKCHAYLTETGFKCWKTVGTESNYEADECLQLGNKDCVDCSFYKKNAVKILIVDDEKTNLLVTKRMLLQNGYEIITTCTSGEKALELIKTNDFNLALLDIQMHGIDGYETCRRLKEIKPALYAIMLTGTVNNESIKKSYKAGAMDFVRKQFDNMELIVRVENAIKIMSTEKALQHSHKTIFEKNAILEKLLITDNLTQVFNRKYILENLSTHIYNSKRYNHPISLMMLDIDRFKLINDNYGHLAGDEAIILLASILSSEMRKTDLVGRYGGDEFILLLPNTNISGAIKKAEQVRKSVELNNFKMAPDIDVTISIGVYELGDEAEPDDLINQADKLLYKAKKNGRNRVEYLIS